MLSEFGLDLDVVYADLQIRNALAGPRLRQIVLREEPFRTMIASGPFFPKSFTPIFKWYLKSFVRLVQRYFNIYGLPEVVYAQTYVGAIVAAEIKARYGIPFVTTLHFSGFLDDSIRGSHMKLARDACRDASLVLCVGSALADKISTLFDCKTMVVPNFIDTGRFVPVSKSDGRFDLVYVGDLIPRKQLPLLLEAFELLVEGAPKLRLHIVGSGPQESELKKWVMEKALDTQVRFLGQKDQDEVARIIANSNLLVLPSRWESFGLVLVEALSCGVPVVTTDNGGSRDIVRPGLGIIAGDHTPKALCQAINDVINNYQEYVPAVLRSAVVRRYSVEAVAPVLSGLFEDLPKAARQS